MGESTLGNRLLPVFVVSFLGMGLAGLTLIYGGQIEGRIAPVMGPLTIHDPQPLPPPSYRYKWQGEAAKIRGCSFVRMEWFLGPRNGRRVQVLSGFTDKPQVRDEGVLEWSGITVTLDPTETVRNSHSDVLHHCPWRPWYTRTPFYDPPQEGEE